MRTRGEVSFESATISTRHGVLDVISDQLDCLLTDGFPFTPEHHRTLPNGLSRSSVSSTKHSGGVIHRPFVSNRFGSTAASELLRERTRLSRAPVERAQLTTMRTSHVLIEERPSNLLKLRTTPIQVSWTTSPAIASLRTNERATDRRAWLWRPTTATKASSSPALRRSRSSWSPAGVRGLPISHRCSCAGVARDRRHHGA